MKDFLELSGRVIEVLPGTMFKVKLDENDMIVLCTICGRLRQNKIRIILGDHVMVEISPYDLERGRITWRGPKKNRE